MPSYVYFAQVRDGSPVKIGVSDNPRLRVRTLLCPVTRERPTLFNFIAVPHGRTDEQWWHERYRSQAICKTRRVGRDPVPRSLPTEWFEPSIAMIDELSTITTESYVRMLAESEGRRYAMSLVEHYMQKVNEGRARIERTILGAAY